MNANLYPQSSVLSLREKRVALAGSPGGPLRGAAGVLKGAGYLVAQAEELSALSDLEAGIAPDLVIFEIDFPPDGAIAVARRLREKPFWRFVSMMVALPAGQAHLEEALVPGINDFILSPFPADELIDKARRLTVIPARRELNTISRVRDPKGGAGPLLGKTLNVSANGILIEVEQPLAIGRTVEIEFFLPNDPDALRVVGRVVRRTTELDLFHAAFGIRFVEMGEREQARIETFVAEREKSGLKRPPKGN